MNRLPFYLTPWSDLHYNWPAGWKVLEVFGANYTGLSGIPLVLAFLHMASVALVVCALARVAWRFFGVSLVDQILAVAIVLNIVLYLLTNASDEAAHEVAIIVPFGAALAARVLVSAGSVVLARDRFPVRDQGSAGRGAHRFQSARRVRLVRQAQLVGPSAGRRLVPAHRVGPGARPGGSGGWGPGDRLGPRARPGPGARLVLASPLDPGDPPDRRGRRVRVARWLGCLAWSGWPAGSDGPAESGWPVPSPGSWS